MAICKATAITTLFLLVAVSFGANAQKIEDVDPSDPNYPEYAAVFEPIFADHADMRCQIAPVSLKRSEEQAGKPTIEGSRSKGHCIMDPAARFCIDESDESTCFKGRIVALATIVRLRSKKTRATVNWGYHVLPDGENLDALGIAKYHLRKDKQTTEWTITERVYSWTMKGLSDKEK